MKTLKEFMNQEIDENADIVDESFISSSMAHIKINSLNNKLKGQKKTDDKIITLGKMINYLSLSNTANQIKMKRLK